jgi:hypothetical protein
MGRVDVWRGREHLYAFTALPSIRQYSYSAPTQARGRRGIQPSRLKRCKARGPDAAQCNVVVVSAGVLKPWSD